MNSLRAFLDAAEEFGTQLSSVAPLPLALALQTRAPSVGVIMATTVIVLVPVLVVYAFAQHWFIRGLSATAGLKG